MAVGNSEKHHNFACRCDAAISRWATNHRRTDMFYRSDNRGAGGAIIDTWDEPFAQRFHVDFRQLDDLQWSALVDGHEGTLPETWDRPLAEARKLGKEPLCLVKQTRHPEMVLSTAETWESFWGASSGRLQVQVTFARDGVMVYVWFLRQLLTRCDAKLLMAERSAVA